MTTHLTSLQSADSANKPSSTTNLNRQVAQYSLAAAVAGVTMLALTQPAAAEVVITKKTIAIGLPGTVSIDMNHDGIADFRLVGSYQSFSGTSFRVENPGVVGTPYASALARGAKIGPSARFSSGTFVRIERATGGYLNHKFNGNWGDNANNRYLGVRFLIDGETHYGWIRLTVNIPTNPTHFMTATVTGYAYETVPNKPIKAGTAAAERPAAEVQVPQSVQYPRGPSLGMLAAGSDAMPLWRRDETSTSK